MIFGMITALSAVAAAVVTFCRGDLALWMTALVFAGSFLLQIMELRLLLEARRGVVLRYWV